MSTTVEQTSAPTAADTVARVLADHPDGLTVKDLATAAGVSASTVSKALTAMEADNAASRTTGPANGNRKAADLWHPVTSDTATSTPADATTNDATTNDATATEEAIMPTKDTTATDDATEDATATDDTTDDATATDDDSASGAQVDADQPTADTPAPPRKRDLRVLLMAGVLGDHPDGVSAAEAIAESGLATGVGDTILIAMEAVGAAERQADDDGHETWFLLPDGDLNAVDPANAPTHVTCHACGHASPIRRAFTMGLTRRTPALRSGPTGRTVEINGDGSARLAKNELRNMVEAFMRTLGPGHQVTPGTVGRELGRSPGAVNNAMEKMPEVCVPVMGARVVTFETLPNLPAPSAAVAAHMTPPVVTTPAATTDTATDAPATDATSADATPAPAAA